MSRKLIPITLIAAGLALPALVKITNISSAELAAEPNISISEVAARHTRAFQAARNAEINASIARVTALRLKAFEAARNAEIDAFMARVAFHRARNAEINASIARVTAQRLKAFEQARNAEINASIARVAYHRARNAEIDASIARVAAQRAKAFEQARNTEINASIARVEFHRARNAEIDASIARVTAQRAKAFEQARNAEINASIARVAAQRAKAFEQARNAEINASITRVAYHRARNAEAELPRLPVLAAAKAEDNIAPSPMTTSAIGRLYEPKSLTEAEPRRHSRRLPDVAVAVSDATPKPLKLTAANDITDEIVRPPSVLAVERSPGNEISAVDASVCKPKTSGQKPPQVQSQRHRRTARARKNVKTAQSESVPGWAMKMFDSNWQGKAFSYQYR